VRLHPKKGEKRTEETRRDETRESEREGEIERRGWTGWRMGPWVGLVCLAIYITTKRERERKRERAPEGEGL
jgi:hypothetical protein